MSNLKKRSLALIKHFWPIGVIIVVWFIFSSPYFLKGLVPFPSKYLVTFFPPWSAQYGMPVKNNAMPDVITQIYPWKKITIDSWKLGQVPLWNPYSFSGTPHAANYQTAVFSPVNLLYFILPFLDAWSISILLQPLLVGLFMYILLRCLDRSREASLIGAIAFMFCGFLTVWMAYGTLGWAVLWLPFLFAGVLLHIDKRAWWRPVIVSLGLTWSFFSGHFQMSVYVLIATAGFIVYETIRTKRWRAGIELGIALVTGLMLAAPQILPSLEAYQQSVRSELFTQTGGIAWQYLVTMFVPDFYGNPVTRNDWFGFYAEWASYVGVIPFLLAVYATVRKAKGIGFFVGLAVISFLIATPSPLNALIIWLKLPAVSTSYAARIIVLTSFTLGILSSFGLDTLREEWKKKKMAAVLPCVLGVGVFLITLWGIVLVVRPFDADKLAIARRNLMLPTGMALAFCAFALFGFMKRWKISYLVVLAFIVLTAADMLRYAGKWMPFDPREYVYSEVDILSFLKREVGRERIFGNLGGEVTNGFALSGIEGYDAVYQKRYGELIRSASDGLVSVPERSVVRFPKDGKHSQYLLELLGVPYVVHRLSDGRYGWAYPYWQYPQYKSIYRNEHYEVFKNDRVLPRAFLASSFLLRDSDQNIVNALYAEGFDSRETIVLETDPRIVPQPGEGTVSIRTYSPNEVVMETVSSYPKLLFLSDVYDAGWLTAVDGQYTPVLRADYDFRAVAVPAGEHVIRMVYWPKSFVYGLWLAGGGMILLIIKMTFH